jgi:DNA-binding CsgD family transcriptional regulator
MSLGRWTEASDAFERAAACGLQATSASDPILGSRLGHLEALRGDPNSLGPLRIVNRAWIIQFNPFRGPAERALWAHETLVARDVLRAPLERVGDRTEVSPRYFGWACWLALRAEADIAIAARAQRQAQALAEAETMATDVLGRYVRFDEAVAASRPVFLPITTRWLAMCRAEAGRLAGASDPDAWQAAADLLRREPYLCAYALMREGEARLSDRRDAARAAAALVEAGSIADRLGARPLRGAINGLLQMAEPAPLSTAARGRYELSGREREVLALVVRGRSDAEIGQTLFISPKTASVHVSNIKGKLGAANRVEIATTALALGLIDPLPARG